MNDDHGARLAVVEHSAREAKELHLRMLDALTGVQQTVTKISTVQDSIASNFTDLRDSINEHHDRLTSLESSRTSHEASKNTFKWVGMALWTVFMAVMGFFGYHAASVIPPAPPH